ncbi:MAG: STAS domain-containing protein [Spirochaetes bacterium]|jgi:anti-sigma B factor antagonist|nr:STAS domain-containing protein [Spirochaetota bacterium]
MDIKISEKGDVVNIIVSGDIEMMSIKDFKTKLFEVGEKTYKDVDIDLSNVEYIDSSGVGVLITLLKKQKSKGKGLNISKVSPKVMNVLKLSSLSDVFNLSV